MEESQGRDRTSTRQGQTQGQDDDEAVGDGDAAAAPDVAAFFAKFFKRLLYLFRFVFYDDIIFCII